MRKWMLLSVSVIGLLGAPEPAEAEPVTAVAALVANGVGFWSAVSATYGAFATAALEIGASLVLSTVGAALTRQMPSTPELKREFPVRTSLPGKRYVYGHTRMTGTPVPWRVRGRDLIGCILFNSRPSDGSNFSMTIDGRKCVFVDDVTGDELTDPADWTNLYDFSSLGQMVKITEKWPGFEVGDNLIRVWIGLGDQTSPPDWVLSRVPEFFQATDGWQGQTVMWCKIDAGGSLEKRQKRWPNPEPIIEMEMGWSMVWDPSDPSQDKDDPDTWTFSDNQARCLLDAVRQNPLRAYTSEQLVEDTFTGAVPLADEDVLRWFDTQNAGSNVYEKRYRVAGVIDWSKGELLDLIQPLADAGAGRLAVVGGKLSYIPGEYQAPVYTMTDILDDTGIDFQRLGSRRDVPYAIKGSWTSEEQEFGTAELEPYVIPGGSTRTDEIEDMALPMIPSGTQCQRVVKIAAMRRAAQKRLTCVLPPSAIKLLPGSGVTAALPSPFGRMNGTWQVEEAQAGVWLQDGEDGKVAFRVPVTLKEDGPLVYAWDPESEEREIQTQSLTDEDVFLGTVQNLTAQTVELNTGGAIVLMIEFDFDPVTDYVIDEYQVSWREDGEMNFIPLPDIPSSAIDDDGNVSGRFGPVEFGRAYDLGVRAVGPTSEGLWSYVLGIVAGLELSGVSATGGPAQVEASGTAPDIEYFKGVRLYRAATGDPFSSAVQVGDDIEVPPNGAFTVTFGNPNSANLMIGSDFSNAGDWSATNGWQVSGGVAEHNLFGGSGTISQSPALVAGEDYRLVADLIDATGSGALHFRLTGDTDVDGANFTSDGMKVEILTAPANPTSAGIYAENSMQATVDDFAVYAVTADDLPPGEADFWLVPYTTTGTNGTPSALGTLTIT